MSDNVILWITFVIYIAIIFIIGIYSYFQTKEVSDYMLGGRSLSAPVAALGAGASDMSSWLILALPGAFMISGFNQIWLPLGLTAGAFVNWGVIAKRLRVYTEVANNSITIPAYFENRFHDNKGILRLATTIVLVIFFTIYIGSGFVSGGVLFSTMFGISYHSALLLGVLIIFVYTCVGGFLAISWVDVFQGSLMLFALLLVPIVVYFNFGSVDVFSAIANIKTKGFYEITSGVPLITIVSLLAWGLGYFGQPHILSRFMAIKDPNKAPKAMWICMIWMILGLLGAASIGILGAAYYTNGISNPESVFLRISAQFFNPWLEGVLLAAVLSAVMSTSSAQLLSLSSAFSVDIYTKFIRKNASQKEQLNVSRLIVLIITLLAILISYNPNSSILNLVGFAWAGLGSSLGTVIVFSLFWSRMNKAGALAGIIVGSVVVLVWPLFDSLGGWFQVYSMVPAFALSCISIFVVSLITAKPKESVKQEYNKYKQLL